MCFSSARRLPGLVKCITACIILVICVGLLQLQIYADSNERHRKDNTGTDAELDRKISEALNHQIVALQNEISSLSAQLSSITAMKKDEKRKLLDSKHFKQQTSRGRVKDPYILEPHQFRNEYDIPSFATFTRKSVLNAQVRLVKQPEVVLPMYADLQADLLEVIDEATKTVYDSSMQFIEGIYRLQHDAGTQYELVFGSTVNSSAPLRLITMFRPFARLESISTHERRATETIYIIVPLQGRGDSLRNFMQNFENEAINHDGNVHLTVVCYGEEALSDAKDVLKKVETKNNFKNYKIVQGKAGEFSRGRALQTGSDSLTSGDSLMFFCDVDMFFSSHFLQQCRSQTWPGKKVFYPIVFSLYNPEVVYQGKNIPSLKDQRIARRDNGFWRDFGFGMTCQYKKDFDDIGGFDLSIKGWGSEDVLLYRKYCRSPKYQSIRTPVNTLFHHWHPKHCDKALSLEQYNACLRTRSITEGSQIQLGMLYLQEKGDKS